MCVCVRVCVRAHIYRYRYLNLGLTRPVVLCAAVGFRGDGAPAGILLRGGDRGRALVKLL